MSTKEKSNVVNFPGTFNGSVIGKSIKEIKEEYNNEALEFVFQQLIMTLNNFTYNTSSSKVDDRDMIMMYEAISSFMNRYHGIEHPLHEVVDEMFTFEDEDDMVEEDDQYEFDFLDEE